MKKQELTYKHNLYLLDPSLTKLIIKPVIVDKYDPKKFEDLKNACLNNQLSKVKELVPLEVNVNFRDDKGRLPIMYAAMRGNIEIIKYLIANNSIFITARDLERRTALWYAVVNGHTDCVDFLLNNGADMTFRERKIANKEIVKNQKIVTPNLMKLASEYSKHIENNRKQIIKEKQDENFRYIAAKYFNGKSKKC